MSTPSKELIAIGHVAFINNEAALKQLVTIFNRIAFAALSVALRRDAAHLFTPEFVQTRAGSFVVIPAGVPHFVAAKNGSVIVQLSGTGKFDTVYLEK